MTSISFKYQGYVYNSFIHKKISHLQVRVGYAGTGSLPIYVLNSFKFV